jgi:transglutaminase-like putative cysteine protease
MTQRRHITLVAAGATIIAALPLSSVFEKWTWLVGALLVVGTMAAAAVALRSVRSPIWLPTLAMITCYVVTLTWLYSDGHAMLGIIPTADTFTHFNSLLVDAGVTIRDSGVPVEDQEGLLFLAGLGVGAVYLAVDLAAVVARRPAIAGIPMVAIYLVPVGTHTKSVTFLAFICTAVAFLWLLATDNVDRVRRFGRRFSGDGRDIDIWEPSPLAAAGRRLAVIGVVVAVILPLAVPGMSSGLLDRFGTGVGDGPGAGNGPGRAGNVNLFSFLSGSLVRETSYDMVKVSTDDPSPFYLRFGVAEDLTSQGFVNRSWAQATPLSRLEEPQRLTLPGVGYKSNAAVIEVLEFNERLLPIYEQVTKVDRLDGSWGYDRRSGVIYSGRNTAKGRKYVVHYTRPEYTPDALRTARDLNDGDQIRNTNIHKPQDMPEIKDIAERLVAGKTNQYDRVRAVYDFFASTNGFKYSLETKAGNSGSAMVDFLREGNRQGYCEQYAAAMAWLLRAVNIPARVAFGFTKGNNRNGNTYTLSNFNLHAWTEVYFDGFGWVPFDATPPSGVSGSVSSPWAPDPNQPTGGSGSAPEDDLRPGQSVSGGASAAATNPYGPNDPGITGGASASENSSTWQWYLLGGAVVLLVLLVLPALRRVAVRRRRLAGTGESATGSASGPVPAGAAASVDVSADGEATAAQAAGLGRARRDAHAAWDELLDTMIDYRVEIDPAETPRLTGERLITEARLPEAAASGVRVLSRAEERASYARSPLTDVDLGGPLRDVRTALREGVSFRTRLQASLLPPSVLAKWRTTTSARYLSLSAAVAHRRESLLRAISPRRLLTRSR